jgi:2-dehydropantoate 2-reductase
MKICVFGTGAIGGHVAARLAKGGADVSIIARGANLEAIKANGLRVMAPDGDMHVHPRAAATAAELGPQDAVLVTTKQTALPSVAAAIGPLLGPDTAVAFIMNGVPWWFFDHEGSAREGTRLPLVDPGDVIRNAIGTERTIGGVVWSACTVIEPGVVKVASQGDRVIFGELDNRISERAQALANALKAGGMGSKASADIRSDLWTKLIGNLANGPLCTVARQDIKTTMSDPVLYEAAIRCTEEGIAIGRALGLTIEMDARDRTSKSSAIAHKPSILQDLEAGRPMEVAALFEQPILLARELGVPAPTLEISIALLKHAARAAGLYNP